MEPGTPSLSGLALQDQNVAPGQPEVPPGQPDVAEGEPEPDESEQPEDEAGPSSSQASRAPRELPPLSGMNYTTLKGNRARSIFYKPSNTPGVTYTFDRMKKPQPGQPKTFYMRCSSRGTKTLELKDACKARAIICEGHLTMVAGEEHSCLMEGARAKEVELEVKQARRRMYERAVLTNEKPMVSQKIVSFEEVFKCHLCKKLHRWKKRTFSVFVR